MDPNPDSGWVQWWMYRGQLSPHGTSGGVRCVACDRVIAAARTAFTLRPTDWTGGADDSLDAVEAFMALEERLRITIDVEDCAEHGSEHETEICADCVLTHRVLLEWTVVSAE